MKKILLKYINNPLALSSAIVFGGTMVANIASYAYHLLMGRLLGPTGYGELSSLLSLLYIFTVPLVVGQTVLIKIVSGFKAHGTVGQSRSLFIAISKAVIICCVLGFPVIFLFAPLITSFLHLTSSSLFILVYAVFVVTLLSIINISILQGYQKFIWFSALTGGAIIVKVLLSVPMVRFGLDGVMWAAIITGLLGYGVSFIPLSFLRTVQNASTNLNKRNALYFAIPTLFTMLGITSMYSTDIILVRHYFGSADSGLYAAIAILGKIIFYASSAVSQVMFPVLSERSAKGLNSNKLVITSVLFVAGSSLALCFIYFMFPGLIIRMLFGTSYSSAGALLGLFGLFITFFSIGNIVSMMCLALGKTSIWMFSLASAVIQIGLISIFHSSIISIITVNIGISALFAIGALLYYFKSTYEKI